MEADSTTLDVTQKPDYTGIGLSFLPCPENLRLYKEFTSKNGDQRLETQIVERMQKFGLLPDRVCCPTGSADCHVISKSARVVDRVQWVCEGCGKRQPIRTGSFFLRLSCSLLQALQAILAWTEDIDCDVAAQHFDLKPKVASSIYDKLDELAVREQSKLRLGGEGSVVLAEMYPDCLTRLSPDTTDQPHLHRILMVADTNHIPTHYHLHVMLKNEPMKNVDTIVDDKSIGAEISGVLSLVTRPGSTVVAGSHASAPEALALQQLLPHCDTDMAHFLTSRIWRQAITVCAASRDICAGEPAPVACAITVQRYLDAALYRVRHSDGFYEHVLRALAAQFTETLAVDNADP